ncbi:uncharacterized protein LOC129601063 [Paramacrobiotus metropolitanus]|uniref:uncharacterized protein LOC129601063 n=1 Tax=Paramacrobiotus metropolitanus TaxID=2943436 RepID=UPI0024459906|nr:uncharacterized protein LOC129601063 [Paramacrobiotus metropolitanus]
MGLPGDPTAPPPPYPAENGLNLNQPQMSAPGAGGLVSVDFIPNLTKPGGIFTWAEYEPFPVILQRANEWLSKNPILMLRTCETVEFNTQSSGAVVNSIESVYQLYGEGANRYVRGLRLWMQPRTDGSSAIQQIGYYNIMPSVRVGVFSVDTAERLDTLIAQANTLFATNPIQGSIRTIETVPLRVGANGVDPDCTAWTERGSTSETFIYMLRIFYETGPPQYESIGIADFVPGVLSEGGLMGRPVLERFPQVLSKAHQWLLSQTPHLRVANVQTLYYKQRWTTHMDTLRMTYTENDLHSYYVRYLRVAYALTNPNMPPQNTGGPIRLNSKLFTPGMLEPPGCCSVGKFENQIQVRERMAGWMRATGAKVISVETVPMRIFSGAENTEGFDTMHTWNKVVSHTHQHGGAGHHHHGGHHHHHGGHHHHHVNHHHHNAHHHHHTTGIHHNTGIHHGPTHTHTTYSKGTENYLILYRVYLDGVYPEPMGYAETGTNIEMYMQQNANACTIL